MYVLKIWITLVEPNYFLWDSNQLCIGECVLKIEAPVFLLIYSLLLNIKIIYYVECQVLENILDASRTCIYDWTFNLHI